MARRRHEYRNVYEQARPMSGLTLLIGTGVVVNLLAFFLDLNAVNVVLLVVLAAAAMVGGVVLHFRILSAWEQRNERHREWLATQTDTYMGDFRSQLVNRQRELEQARQDWARPMVAAVAVTLSTVLVPYELIGSLAPHPLVEPLEFGWATVSLVTAAICVVLGVLAARRQERAGDIDDTEPRPSGGKRRVGA